MLKIRELQLLAPGPSDGIGIRVGIYINSKLIDGIDIICTDESFV